MTFAISIFFVFLLGFLKLTDLLVQRADEMHREFQEDRKQLLKDSLSG